MVKQRGRPCKKEAQTEKYLLRLTKDERLILQKLSLKYDTSIAEVLRKAIQTQYNLAKYSE